MIANSSLQEQVDRFNARMGPTIPADLLRDLQSPIEQLVQTGAAEKALKVGARAPDFTLPDINGNPVTLLRLLAQGPAVIAFYRGEWCPYCNLQLRAYQQILPQIRSLGASLVAVSPQTPDHSLSMAEKNALGFAVLSDVGNLVARRYGLVFTIEEPVRAAHKRVGADLPAFNADNSWELPIPGTFIVDTWGTVRLASVNPDFTHRLEPSAILEKLEELQV